jgi:hypothetical protein
LRAATWKSRVLRAQWRDNSTFRVTGTRGARVCVRVHLHYYHVPIGGPICRMAPGQGRGSSRSPQESDSCSQFLCELGSSRGECWCSRLASPRLGWYALLQCHLLIFPPKEQLDRKTTTSGVHMTGFQTKQTRHTVVTNRLRACGAARRFLAPLCAARPREETKARMAAKMPTGEL